MKDKLKYKELSENNSKSRLIVRAGIILPALLFLPVRNRKMAVVEKTIFAKILKIMQKELENRSGGQCELCGGNHNPATFPIPFSPSISADTAILICENCKEQIEDPEKMNPNYWRCLNDSMWSPVPAVQVMVWRILNKLKAEGWPQDLLDMMYMDEETKNWAKAENSEIGNSIVHRDSNGNILTAGDTVVLIKDLKVKGSSMVAKQGTSVRRISLDMENEKYIEGRVDGQHIVIITDFVKKV